MSRANEKSQTFLDNCGDVLLKGLDGVDKLTQGRGTRIVAGLVGGVEILRGVGGGNPMEMANSSISWGELLIGGIGLAIAMRAPKGILNMFKGQSGEMMNPTMASAQDINTRVLPTGQGFEANKANKTNKPIRT